MYCVVNYIHDKVLLLVERTTMYAYSKRLFIHMIRPITRTLTTLINLTYVHFKFIPACDCDLRGVTNDGDCAREAGLGVQPGNCFCKSNTIGRTCGECEPGFFNLSISNLDGCQGEVLLQHIRNVSQHMNEVYVVSTVALLRTCLLQAF